uniref:hypothetical protein n=1 Tax=Drechslerella dactyloides TaxID=74499 RepID=UPI0022FDB07C|nr:hypothetical protein PNX16_mgp082 [Drechslerella dactyloides]WAN89769.1 hypothetical protein [Drechslerella dactyloides]
MTSKPSRERGINCTPFYWSCNQRYVLSAYILFIFHIFFKKKTNSKRIERLGYNKIQKRFYSSSARKTLKSPESRPSNYFKRLNFNIKCMSNVLFEWSNYLVFFSPAFFIVPRFNQFNKHNFSSNASLGINLLNPYWLTGFVDAEGSFTVSISKSNRVKVGWTVIPGFKITLHKKDRAILEMIQSFFNGVGNITEHGDNTIHYRIYSIDELYFVIKHFDKYYLITQKRADYELWRRIIEIIKNKEHLTKEGIEKIVAIRASINLGLSPELKIAFPNVSVWNKPKLEVPNNIDPNWMAGLTSGEGCFYVSIVKNSKYNSGFQVRLKFLLAQHARDIELLQKFPEIFGCGSSKLRSNKEAGDFVVSKLHDFNHIIIPFFDKYKIVGEKVKDYEDFKKVLTLINNGAHLTFDGVNIINEIKSGMNKGR